MMRPEGHKDEEQDDDFFDDVSETFLLCALHQVKIIAERWKFWSGTVPMDVSIQLHRLETMLSMNESNRENDSLVDNHQSAIISTENFQSSQTFLDEIQNYPTLEKYFTQVQHRIILQGPDRRQQIVEEKRRIHFWCCH